MKESLSRRSFIKLGAGFIALGAASGLAGCSGGSDSDEAESGSETSFDPSDWDSVLEAAKGTTVTYYGYGQYEGLNAWFEGDFSDTMKEKYDITFEYVQVTNTAEIITMLQDELQAGIGEGEGVCDVAWVNGENFAQCKMSNVLWGDYVQYLPNMQYYDSESLGVNDDDGYPIEGMESLWGTTVNALIYDSARLDESEVPQTADEFMAFAQAHPGEMTYPAIPDFNGTRFCSQLIMSVCGSDCFEGMDENTTTDEMREKLADGLDFLRDLNPYLWNEGLAYPPTQSDATTMFANGEIYFLEGNAWIAGSIEAGTYPATARSVPFECNILAHHYLTIPYNCPNLAAALVMCNEWLSPECVAERCLVNYVPPTDCMLMDTLSDEQRTYLEEMIEVGGQYAAPLEEFYEHGVANVPATAVETFENLILNEVMGKYND